LNAASFALDELQMSIKIGRQIADSQYFFNFQDGGGGGHLAKWRRPSGLAFFELSMSYLVCVLNFFNIEQ
jgi:hypothetical protein